LEIYDVEGQKKRSSQIRQLLIANHLCDIDADGRPNGKRWLTGGNLPDKGGITEWFYFCQGLWNEDENYGNLTEKMLKYYAPLDHFTTFEPFFCILELVRNKQALSVGLVKKFEGYAKKYLEWYMKSQEDFIGVNDNTPCLMVAGLVLGGEYFGEQRWIEEAESRLLRLQSMLERRGFLSEYNSLTYTPLSLYGLSAISNYAKHKECIRLSLACEARIWEAIAALYQPSVSQTAGPYARAYPVDKLAQSYNMRTLLYVVLGDECGVTPINTIFAGDKDENFYWHISAAHIGSMLYHCPKELGESMLVKDFPYVVQGTAEGSASADSFLLPLDGYVYQENVQCRNVFEELNEQDEIFEYGAGVINLYTYFDETYSMGTATRDWHNGVQTDNFTLLYADRKKAVNQSQVGTLFANYVVNASNLMRDDLGRKMAFQSERTAMVLYRPKWQGEKVLEAGLNLIFGNSSLLKNVSIGDAVLSREKLDEEGILYRGTQLIPVFVHTAGLYIMLIPLVAQKDCEDALIEFANMGENAKLTIYNYKGDGKERIYHKKGFCCLTNGFVCEVRRENEYGSFDEFIKIMKEFSITDEIRTNIHTRYALEREICYKGSDKTLACCVSPLTDGVKYMTVDGRQISEEKFIVTGVC